MTCKDCIHFKACHEMASANNVAEFNTLCAEDCGNFSDRSSWVKLPSEGYTFTIRGDLARGIIIANCRAAEEKEHESNEK